MLVACASHGSAPPTASGTDGANGAASPRAPKLLTFGLQQEPAGFNGQLSQGTGGTGGNTAVLPIAHNYLVVQDPTGRLVPQLATQALSVDDGTWRINPDGSMVTIWKLQPGVSWQDGTPFTAADLLFSFEVYTDRAVPNSQRGALASAASASAPDPHTFIILWSSIYVEAGKAEGLTPLPAHLVRALYEEDKAGLASSNRFTTDFVGLGPFRLARWEGGVQMDFVRHDGYFLGHPPLDGIVVRFLGDATALIANVLAEAADVVFISQSEIEAVVEVGRRWAGTGNRVHLTPSLSLRYLEIQHRPELAEPRPGLTSRLVRQGLYHALDRPALNEAVNAGLAVVADSWIAPNDEIRPAVEAAVPQFAYDPARATQLLAQAGWTRGPDGVLVHRESGERFRLMVYGSRASVREATIIGDGWKAVGVEPNLYVIPPALDRDRQHRSTLPGLGLVGSPADEFSSVRLHSRSMTSEANGWSGPNRGGYSNPRVDALLDRLVATIDPRARIQLQQQLLEEQMGDVALMPLYWPVEPTLVLKSVRGVQDRSTWNVWRWQKD
jgi:peptide/nickel transport system substrate-binding protein